MDNYDENNQLVKSGPGALRIVGFILAFILAPVGLILSIVGVVKKEGSKGLSIAGIIIGALNVAVALIITLCLVGTMAPQLVKYTSKKNVSADTQFADTIKTELFATAMEVGMMRTDTVPTTNTYTNIEDIPEGAFRDSLEGYLGCKLEDLKNNVKSGNGQSEIMYTLSPDDLSVSVMITNTDKTGGKKYVEENFIVVGNK